MPQDLTYVEKCPHDSDHYSLSVTVRNVPLEQALKQQSDTCPVCGRELERYTEEH